MTVNRDDEEKQKKAVFESMAPKRQAHILKKGYDKWDPFLAPKDPIDIRRDESKRTTQQLVRDFLQNVSHEGYSNSYGQGALEMALGLINNEDKIKGMYDFAVWYYKDMCARKIFDD